MTDKPRFVHTKIDLAFALMKDGTIITSDGLPRGSWDEEGHIRQFGIPPTFRKATPEEAKQFGAHDDALGRCAGRELCAVQGDSGAMTDPKPPDFDLGLAIMKREGGVHDFATGREITGKEKAAYLAREKRRRAAKIKLMQQFEHAMANIPEKITLKWLGQQIETTARLDDRDREEAVHYLQGIVLDAIARGVIDPDHYSGLCAKVVSRTPEKFSWGW
jgi:hypothetical protein